MLSITKENLRRIILEEIQLLTEITFASAVNNLGAKKMRKAVRRWHDERPRFMVTVAGGRRLDELSPDEEAKFIQNRVGQLKDWLLDIVPEDLEDNQKGLVVTWLARLARDLETGYMTQFLEGNAPGRDPWSDFEMFFHYQQFMGEKDLNRIADLDELSQVVRAARPQIEKHQEGKDYGDVSKGTEVFRDDDEWFIAALHNKGAACSFGKGTDWCTAAPGLDYFADYYEENDPLFYFEERAPDWEPAATDLDTAGAPRYPFHYGSQQFMDEADRQVSSYWFDKLHKLLMQTEAPNKYPILPQWTRSRLLHSDSGATPEELQEAVDAPDIKYAELLKVAQHPNATEEILRQLIRRTGGETPDYAGGRWRSSSEGLALKSKIADHPNTTPELMAELVEATIEGQATHAENLAKSLANDTLRDSRGLRRGEPEQAPEMSLKFFTPLLTRLIHKKTISNEDMKRLGDMVDSKMVADFIKVKLNAREQGEEPEARDIRQRVIDSMKFASPADHQEEEFRPWSPHVDHNLEETYSRWKKIIH